jgi:hypothetical protein
LISFDISASVTDQFLEHAHGYVHGLQSACCHGGHRQLECGGRER